MKAQASLSRHLAVTQLQIFDTTRSEGARLETPVILDETQDGIKHSRVVSKGQVIGRVDAEPVPKMTILVQYLIHSSGQSDGPYFWSAFAKVQGHTSYQQLWHYHCFDPSLVEIAEKIQK